VYSRGGLGTKRGGADPELPDRGISAFKKRSAGSANLHG